MRHLARIGLLALTICLGVMAVVLTTAGLSASATTTAIDLVVEVKAPEHVAVDEPYVVNVSFANKGTADAPDNPVTAVLPQGTQFVTATNKWGEPLAPDEVVGNVFTWDVYTLCADSTWGHIFIVLEPDLALAEGTLLTTTVSITTSAPEPNTENNTASVTSMVTEAAGSSKHVHAREIMPADVLTYTIRINLAQQSGTGTSWRWVRLTDTLPFSHQVRFLGWNGEVTGTQIDGHKLQWQGHVQAGEPFTLQYRLGVEGTVTSGTFITNVAHMGWSNHNLRLGPVTTVVTLPYGTMGLGPYQGGQLYHHQCGVSLTVPPGAVTDTTRFHLGPMGPGGTLSTFPPGSLLFANRAFEMEAWRFGEPVGQFNRPLTITVNYTDTDVQGFKLETLRLWTREGPQGPWAMLGAPVHVTSGTLVFTTTHFSQFAVFGEAAHQVYLPIVTR
jgi:hypothetical protein